MNRHKILISGWIYLLLIGCGVGVDSNIDEEAPEIVSVNPGAGAENVDTSSNIEVNFSENIDVDTLLPSAFFVKQGDDIVAGIITYNDVNAIFTPAIPLNSETLYQVVMTRSVTDIAGNYLKNERAWVFETTPRFNIIPPRVTNTYPQNNANDVGLNQSIKIQFTVEMDITSLQNIDVVYVTGAESVDGFITYANKTMLFIPAKSWQAQKTVQVTLKNAVQNSSGKKFDSDYIFSFKTGITHDRDLPQVIRKPDVIANNAAISVMFDEAMDPSRFIGRSVQLRERGTSLDNSLASIVNYYNRSVIVKPIKPLLPQMEYELMITPDVIDLASNSISSNNLQIFFRVGNGRDDVAPVIFDDYLPRADEVDVSVSAKVVVAFNELLNPLTVQTQSFELRNVDSRVAVVGVVRFINDSQSPNVSVVEFQPLTRLQANTTYLFSIKDIEDLAGNRLTKNPFTWQFTTNTDSEGPQVNATSPSANEENVSIALGRISVTFNEQLDVSTVNDTNFTVATSAGVPLDAEVNYDETLAIVTFNFSELVYATEYVVTLSSSITDVVGNPIEALTWRFTTSDGAVSPEVKVLPATDAANVDISLSSVSATFDKVIQVDTVNSDTFQILLNGEAVAGKVSLSDDGKVAAFVFSPQSDLAFSTTYNIVLTSGISDLEGNTLSDFSSAFTTQDQGRLAVIIPTVSQSSMPIDSSVSVRFSTSLDPISVSNATVFLEAAVTGASIPVEVSLSQTDDKVIVINPQQNLNNSTVYIVVVTTAVIGANLVEDYRDLSFTTEKDKVPPTIIDHCFSDIGAENIPLKCDIDIENVPAKSNIVIEFSEPVSVDGIAQTVEVFLEGTREWKGTVSLDDSGRLLTFTPSRSRMEFARQYEVRVDYRIEDLAGNPLGTPGDLTDPQSDLIWRFTVEQDPNPLVVQSAAQ